MQKNNFLVSIFCPTYNHSKYIEQCLNGIVMQKTNFRFEVFVQDDASTDASQKIIKEFAEKYNFIVPVLHTENIYSKGGNLNEYFFKKAKGKYIAFCEGDDIWTEPLKLQKQVDFLEANPNFTICFHNARKLIQETEDDSGLFFIKQSKDIFTITDIIKNNFIPTLTCVFRNNLFKEFPNWFSNAYPGDWPLHILNAQYGKIKYIDEIMATYRLHEQGICSGSKPIDNYEKSMVTLKNVRDHLNYPYSLLMSNTISKKYYSLAKLYIIDNDNPSLKDSIIQCIKYNPFCIFKLKYNPLLLFIRMLINRLNIDK
jgi:glycosyltransferase involved in cell wall biosynthesis